MEYGAENQNWGISQSNQKNIYAANNGGLLEFNGAEWQLYGSPNGSTLRSVKTVGDIVYTGCYREFGYWKKNTSGNLYYTSLTQSLNVALLEDEEFWNIIEFGEWVLFQSLERIYIYNAQKNIVKLITSSTTNAKLFKFGETVYFHSRPHGLFKIENGTSVLVSDVPEVKENVVLGLFRIGERTVFVNEKAEFYFFNEDQDKVTPWNTAFNKEVGPISVYSSLQLADGSLVLGTISNGIYQIDKNGTLIQNINQEKGLNNNTVLSMYQDVEHNLWLALDNGISVLNLNTPFKEFIDKNGKIGVVYASAKYNGYLYLGTNQGLFSKKIGGNKEFNLMPNTGGQVWLLKVLNGILFCGHNNGTYQIQGEKATLIADFPGTWDIKPIPNRKDILLQGNYNGLSVLENTNGTWRLSNVIKGFDISSRFYEFIRPQKVLINHEFKGIYTLDLDTTYTKVLRVKNEPSKGVGASLVTYEGEVKYTCSNGIFTYNVKQDSLIRDTVLTKMLYEDKADKPIGVFIADNAQKRLWCFTDNNISFVMPSQFDGVFQVNRISIPKFARKNFGVLGFENLSALEKDTYLIGRSNGYLTLDLNKLIYKDNLVFINSVAHKLNTSEFQKIEWPNDTKLPYDKNNLSITYHVPSFDKYTEVNYSYKLEGAYERWSDWSTATKVFFDNLSFGDYTFKVRAKIGNNRSKNIAEYKFTIQRPWYASNLAFLMYLLIFGLFGFLIHKLYKGYYKKQQEQILRANKKKLKRKKLKAQKKIVQIKNEKLHEEVASKNRELAISTMSIIKKNEFLNAIKDQLKKNNEDPNIKSVIRTIDRNITNEDDWKFFEDAFNNADKDFLKKIKNIHPELTPNDLRLCAYLRLNLSSKEIAPLLNISIKSVEVKRYRLRKKMQLEHEEGLVTYIMAL